MIIKSEIEGKEELTNFGGLPVFTNIWDTIGLGERLRAHLPEDKGDWQKADTVSKFRALAFGFLCEAQCLDDMNWLSSDVGFLSVCGGHVHTPEMYGQWLKKFSDVGIRGLNDALIDTALRLRQATFSKDEDFVLDIDSTSHEQYGRQMEGVAMNYQHIMCLDSIQAFDNRGFQYWMNVRPGNTFTSNGVSEIIDAVFRKVTKHHYKKRYARADSGFCNNEFFHACFVADVKFVTAMRANMYEPIAGTVKDWNASKRVRFRDGRECEIGHTLYGADNGKQLRVVFIRAKKEETEGRLFTDYDYRAFITNIGQHEMADEKIILFYQKRGNAENFIRELKNGFDFHHFPCGKLIANRAYALIGSFAYNMMRYVSFINNPKKQNFSKLLRLRIVKLCARVVRHARTVVFRYVKHIYEEVELFKKKIYITLTGRTLSQRDSPPAF